jgi:hypothetical protein
VYYVLQTRVLGNKHVIMAFMLLTNYVVYCIGQDIQPPAQAQVEAKVENAEEPDNWWELFWNLVVEDEAEVEEQIWNYGMFDYAQHVDKYCSRRLYRTPPLSGEDWVQKQVGG